MLKSHPDVFDVLVVGVPDERWGERVTAVVQAREGRTPSVEDLDAHCRTQIAAYKAPKQVFLVDRDQPGAERQARLPVGQGVRQGATRDDSSGARVAARWTSPSTRPRVSTTPTRPMRPTGSRCSSTSRRRASRIDADGRRRTRSARCTPPRTDTRIRPGRSMSARSGRRRGRDLASTCCGASRLAAGRAARRRRLPRGRHRARSASSPPGAAIFGEERDAAVHPRGRVVDGPGRGRRALAVPRERRRAADAGGRRRDLARARPPDEAVDALEVVPVAHGRVVPAPLAGRDQPATDREPASADPGLFRLAVGLRRPRRLHAVRAGRRALASSPSSSRASRRGRTTSWPPAAGGSSSTSATR